MTSTLKNFTLEIVKISIRGPIYLIPSVVRSFPYSHYQMNLLYLMVNINEKIILRSLTKEEWGKNKTNNYAIKAKEVPNICNWMGNHHWTVRVRFDDEAFVLWAKKTKKMFSWESHICYYTLVSIRKILLIRRRFAVLPTLKSLQFSAWKFLRFYVKSILGILEVQNHQL